MPRGDGTGPRGAGPMSGRGMGYCAGFNAPGFAGGCYGAGMGRGHGFRRMFYAAGRPGWGRFGFQPDAAQPGYAAPDEKKLLENEAAYLENELKQIHERLKSLDGNT